MLEKKIEETALLQITEVGGGGAVSEDLKRILLSFFKNTCPNGY